jgi:hypothetical protein
MTPRRALGLGLSGSGLVMLAVYLGAAVESKIFNAYQDLQPEQRPLELPSRRGRRPRASWSAAWRSSASACAPRSWRAHPRHVRPGDRITLITPDREHEYVVQRTRITEPDDLSALRGGPMSPTVSGISTPV